MLAVQVGADKEELALERKLREEAEQALDRDRRTLQLASITSGAGMPGWRTKNAHDSTHADLMYDTLYSLADLATTAAGRAGAQSLPSSAAGRKVRCRDQLMPRGEALRLHEIWSGCQDPAGLSVRQRRYDQHVIFASVGQLVSMSLNDMLLAGQSGSARILKRSQLAGTSDAVANLKTKNWELRKELVAVTRDRDNLRRLLNEIQK